MAGVTAHVTPLVSAAFDELTAVAADVAAAPLSVIDAGFNVTLASVGGALFVTVSAAEWLSAPRVPVTEYVPAEAVAETVTLPPVGSTLTPFPDGVTLQITPPVTDAPADVAAEACAVCAVEPFTVTAAGATVTA